MGDTDGNHLKKNEKSLILHSGRGSQYTSKRFLTQDTIKQDVQHCIRYYNQNRLYSANSDLSPIAFEQCLLKVSGLT